jgi:hypothetical protein
MSSFLVPQDLEGYPLESAWRGAVCGHHNIFSEVWITQKIYLCRLFLPHRSLRDTLGSLRVWCCMRASRYFRWHVYYKDELQMSSFLALQAPEGYPLECAGEEVLYAGITIFSLKCVLQRRLTNVVFSCPTGPWGLSSLESVGVVLCEGITIFSLEVCITKTIYKCHLFFLYRSLRDTRWSLWVWCCRYFAEVWITKTIYERCLFLPHRSLRKTLWNLRVWSVCRHHNIFAEVWITKTIYKCRLFLVPKVPEGYPIYLLKCV